MIKKLVFTLPFLICLLLLTLKLNIFLKDFSFLFNLDLNVLYQICYLAALTILASFFFTLFVSFALDYKIVLPVIIFSCLTTLLFISFPFNIIFAASLMLAFLISFAFIYQKITKDPSSFSFSSHILKLAGQLTTFLLIVVSLTLYFNISLNNQKTFDSLTSSLIDLSLSFTNLPQDTNNTNQFSNLALTPDQISLLKQNPDVLKQYGLDPLILDQLSSGQLASQDNALDLARPLVKKQINDIFKPYLPYFPLFFTFIFFLNIQFFCSIISLLISPIFYLIFYILEKTGFVKYATEQREVKKLVV